VAYEPPSLIGSKDKSVSSEKSQEIKDVVKKLAPQPVLIGAGIHSAKDILTGLEMGAKGFLIATDVVKAKDPGKELRELARAMK
jgi:triosephosphate isomerase